MSYQLEKKLIRLYCEGVFPAHTIAVEPHFVKASVGTYLIEFERGFPPTPLVRGQGVNIPANLTISSISDIDGSNPDIGEERIDSIIDNFRLISLSLNAAGDNFVLGTAETPLNEPSPQGDFFLDFQYPFISLAAVNLSNQYAWTITAPFIRRQGLSG